MDAEPLQGLGFDWIVHYRSEETEDRTSILPIFSIPNATLALECAIFVLGGKEIIGLMRRDLIANADEVISQFSPTSNMMN